MSSRGDIAVVLGTRPEIIKLAPVVNQLGPRARVIHTGQHWDDVMSGQYLREQGITAGVETLSGIGGLTRAAQIASGIAQLEKMLLEDRPRALIVQGDTNSTSIGAQVGNYLDIPVIHVEAGLRSHDRGMPEEINRQIVGVLADVHCAATSYNAENLLSEGVDRERIYVTGNTVVEATLRSLAMPDTAQDVEKGDFILATIHRPENTDAPEALERILMALAAMPLPVRFVAHPRTVAAAQRFGLRHLLARVQLLESVSHSHFLSLATHATLLISDSGGIQEEVTVLKKPLLVVRRSTERPESIDAGFSTLVTPEMSIRDAAATVLADESLPERLEVTPSPYGDGSAGYRIAEIAIRLAEQKELALLSTTPRFATA